MGTPNSNNGIIDITIANPSILGSFNIGSFLVNSTGTNWAVKLTDTNGEVIFAANHSGTTQLPFSHTLPKTLLIKDIIGTTLTNISDVLVYLE